MHDNHHHYCRNHSNFEGIYKYLCTYVQAMNVLHPKIVPDSSKNRVIFSHLIGSWKIYNKRPGHSQKQIMTDAMSKKRVVTEAMIMV